MAEEMKISEQEAKRLIKWEIDFMLLLKGKPNVVQIEDYVFQFKEVTILMERIEGENLEVVR